MMLRFLLLLGSLAVLGGCGAEQPQRPHRADWVLRSKVVFFAQDLQSEREPAPLNTFRLWFPYVAGDLYGSPNTGDFIHPTMNPDYSFEIDLNRTQGDLLKSLQPTQLSMSWLHIEPSDARIARLSPFAMQADGIDPIGATEWIDGDSKRCLTLVFFDRAARISGSTKTAQGSVRYDVQAAAAGYVWIARAENAGGGVTDGSATAGEVLYQSVHRPQRVLLAVRRPSSNPDMRRDGEMSCSKPCNDASASGRRELLRRHRRWKPDRCYSAGDACTRCEAC